MTAPKNAPGRKPVDQLSKAGKPQGRDVIWKVIRQQGEFTYRSLQDATDIPNKTLRSYISGLIAAGYLERQADGKKGLAVFRLVRDQGIHAPRLRPDGKEVQQGRASEALWIAMRMLKQFTPRDLAIHASNEELEVSEVHAKDYCKHLAKAKYLRVVTPGGSKTGQATYLFVRFTGPRAPMVQRVKQVFDPNTGEIAWPVSEKGDGS